MWGRMNVKTAERGKLLNRIGIVQVWSRRCQWGKNVSCAWPSDFSIALAERVKFTLHCVRCQQCSGWTAILIVCVLLSTIGHHHPILKRRWYGLDLLCTSDVLGGSRKGLRPSTIFIYVHRKVNGSSEMVKPKLNAGRNKVFIQHRLWTWDRTTSLSF
jgi:hypothetical protein